MWIKKKTVWLAGLFSLVLVFLPAIAYGQEGQGMLEGTANAVGNVIGGFTTSASNKLIGGIVNLVSGLVEATLLPLSSFLVDTAFRLQTTQGFISQNVVQIGWNLTIDLANMAFILVLLVIGLATILRVESYGIKKLLPKLILVALLINFSLVIGGVFIDMGNSLTSFFIYGEGGAPTGETAGIGSSIAAAVNLSQTLEVNEDFGQELAEDEADVGLLPTIHAVARLAVTSILTFTLLAIALILLFRMVYLWILLALAPIAWISLVIPKAGSYWSKWWNDFLKWSFVPAIMAFFLFFGLQAAEALAQAGFTDAVNAHSSGLPGGVPFQSMGHAIQFTVVVMIMLYGVTVAPRWAGQGGSTAMSWANTTKDWSLGKIKGGAGFLGRTAVQKMPKEGEVDTPLGKLQYGTRTMRERYEKMPGVGRMMGGPGAGYKADQKLIKEAGRDLPSRPQDLMAVIDQKVATPEGAARRAAAMKALAEKGKLGDEHKKRFKSYLDTGASAKDILQYMPSWAYDEKIQQDLAEHSATQKDWGPVADLESDSPERTELAMDTLKKKIPKKPNDFSLINKDNIDTDDSDKPQEKKLSADEKLRRATTMQTIIELFQEGKLTAKHINAAANKNPGLWEALIKEFNRMEQDNAEEWNKVPQPLRKYIKGSAGHGALAPEEPGGEEVSEEPAETESEET